MSGSHFIAQTSKFMLIDATAVTLGQGHGKVIPDPYNLCAKYLRFSWKGLDPRGKVVAAADAAVDAAETNWKHKFTPDQGKHKVTPDRGDLMIVTSRIFCFRVIWKQKAASIYDNTYHHKTQNLKAIGFELRIVWSLWNMTHILTALLQRQFRSDTIVLTLNVPGPS